MPKSVHFIKRVPSKNKHASLEINKLSKQYKSQPQLQELNIKIQKKDISLFKVICIFEKKVIITYNHQLNMFGYFDLHAVHERIRYEYYCHKVKMENDGVKEENGKKILSFDQKYIEKEGKLIQEVFGKQRKVLIDISCIGAQCLFKGNKQKTTLWGITLQANKNDQICITSYRSILRQALSDEDLIEIVEDIIGKGIDRIPRKIDGAIAEVSCKSAYKFNDELDIQTAKAMIMNLSNCSFPWHCVHGRTTIHLKDSPIERKLRKLN